MKNYFYSFSLLLAIGTAIIVFNSCNRDEPIPITPTTDPGVVIDGVRWATRNVDMPGTFAENPESLGMFYQWGRNIGWSSTDPLINSNGGTEWDGIHTGNTWWTRANDPCPQGWRVPTLTELEKLADIDNVATEWIAINGVSSRVFTDRATNNSIFLPAAGRRRFANGALFDAGDSGYYWSSTYLGTLYGHRLWFSTFVYAGDIAYFRSDGFSVRCVSDD